MPDNPTLLCEMKSAAPIQPEAEIRKRVDRRFVLQEAIVTRAAHELSLSTDLYYTPRVIGYSIADQLLCLERLADLVPLRDLLADDRVLYWVLSRVARALAFLHARLQIPADQRVPVPAGWMMGETHPVTLHGDFNLINITWQSSSNRLVILDWSSAPALGFIATVGPRELDIAHFLRCLLLQQTAVGKAMYRYAALRDIFLKEYQTSSPVPIHHKRLARIICRLNRAILFKQFRQGKVRSLAHSILGQCRFERDRLRPPSFIPQDQP